MRLTPSTKIINFARFSLTLWKFHKRKISLQALYISLNFLFFSLSHFSLSHSKHIVSRLERVRRQKKRALMSVHNSLIFTVNDFELTLITIFPHFQAYEAEGRPTLSHKADFVVTFPLVSVKYGTILYLCSFSTVNSHIFTIKTFIKVKFSHVNEQERLFVTFHWLSTSRLSIQGRIDRKISEEVRFLTIAFRYFGSMFELNAVTVLLVPIHRRRQRNRKHSAWKWKRIHPQHHSVEQHFHRFCNVFA